MENWLETVDLRICPSWSVFACIVFVCFGFEQKGRMNGQFEGDLSLIRIQKRGEVATRRTFRFGSSLAPVPLDHLAPGAL